METLKFVNKKGPVDFAYRVEFEEWSVGVYAPSIAAARQKAIEHFRPKKKLKNYISIYQIQEE